MVILQAELADAQKYRVEEVEEFRLAVIARDAEIARLTKERDGARALGKAEGIEEAAKAAEGRPLDDHRRCGNGGCSWDERGDYGEGRSDAAEAIRALLDVPQPTEVALEPGWLARDGASAIARAEELGMLRKPAAIDAPQPDAREAMSPSKKSFAIGDKLIRRSGSEWFGMDVGDIGTVTEVIPTSGNWSQLQFAEFGGVYNDFNFHLVSETSPAAEENPISEDQLNEEVWERRARKFQDDCDE